jgi:hypothetical protein
MSDYIERPDRLQLTRFSDLVNRAPSPWLIDGVIRETSVATLYGRRGSYKSFVALDMAASVATGVPWQGHTVRNKGLVIYVAAEGGGGMVQRARAWSEQHDIPPYAVNMRLVTEPFICMPASEDMDLLVDRIREVIDWKPEGDIDLETGHTAEHPMAREWPQLIVIDTLARCLHGDESKAIDMGMFVQGVDRLKIEFNCAVLIIHHTGWDETHERGHTSLGGACDTVYKLEAEAAPDTGLTLSCEKMKDSREPEDLRLVRRDVEVARRAVDDPNEDLRSVVIESELINREARRAHILRILEELGSATWLEWLNGSGLPRTTFQNIVSELRRTNVIAKENDVFTLV